MNYTVVVVFFMVAASLIKSMFIGLALPNTSNISCIKGVVPSNTTAIQLRET